MVSLGGFDPSQHQPAPLPSDPLPAGWYVMQIIEEEVKETHAGKGSYLELVLEIVESHHPEHRGRRVWDRLMLWHASEKAQQFGWGKLTSICEAVGHRGPIDDSDALRRKPMRVKVTIREGQNGYGPSNEAAEYETLQQASAPDPTPAPPPPPRSKPKWAR